MVIYKGAGRHAFVARLLPYAQLRSWLDGDRKPWRGGDFVADEPELDLNLLLALGALLEDRNLTRAGERIGVSQPAMSAALARLRRHFGDELLEREGRGYRLTVFGEQLLPTVQDALRHMEATMQRSPRFDPADSDREFSVAASDYTVSILAGL